MVRKEGIDFDDPGMIEIVGRLKTLLGIESWALSPWDGRKLTGNLADGRRAGIHFEPVSSANASQYRGWFATNPHAWDRIRGVRPDAIVSYTVMVARSADDRWWWFQAFRDDDLRPLFDGHIHKVTSSYWRLPPSVAKDAAATPVVDIQQTSLWDDASPPTCTHDVLERYDLADGSHDYQCRDCKAVMEATPA